MNTEHEIIYSLLHTLRDSEYNNDERVDERWLRSALLKYRADSMRKHYKNGITASDDVFQTTTIKLSYVSNYEFRGKYPKVIRFENETGFYLQKKNFDIPIMDSENYTLSKSNYHNSNKPKAKVDGQFLILYIGNRNYGTFEIGSETDNTIRAFIEQLSDPSNGNSTASISEAFITAELKSVLYNPSDADDYNWEIDVYPFPAERLDELTTQLLVKEFNFMKQSKKDEIQNARADEIRYHDNEEINSN